VNILFNCFLIWSFSGLENGLVHIWDVSGISDSPLETLKGHTEHVNIVYFSWCGKLIGKLKISEKKI
jgi:WD40 repeat protein